MLKIAFRNIRKNKGFAIINMAGLALGITCFLLLAAYIHHEMSYDKFLPNSDRIAYVSMAYKSGEEAEFSYSNVTPTAFAPNFQREFPEIEHAVRMFQYNGAALVEKGNDHVKENKLMLVDQEFLSVIDYPIRYGNAKDPLSQPNTIVLTEALAEKYFPKQEALGKSLIIDNTPWMITAIIDNQPTYSEVKFDALLSNKGLARYQEENWGSANDNTFLLLKANADFNNLQQKINAYVKEKLKEVIAQGYAVEIFVEPLKDVHLHSKAGGSGNLTYLYIFGFLGAALLIISCVNFTNLSLAHATERAREIGVKKVLGANRGILFRHFLYEGGLMVFISMATGLLLAALLLPAFSQYMSVPMKMNIWNNPVFYLVVLGFFFILTFLASGWPAWFISRFKPISVLKGNMHSDKKKFPLAKLLITVQYCLSIFLVICTLLAYRQMQFIQNMNTGLNRSKIVVLDGDIWKNTGRETFKNKLLELNTIKGVSASYDSPVNIQGGYTIIEAEGKSADFSLSLTAIPIEKDFLSVFEIPILAGAPLNETDIIKAQDTSANRSVAMVVNKLAAASLGWTPEQAIGKTINLNGRKGPIKAVVDNFNFASLRDQVQPIALFPEYNYFGNIFLKIAPGVRTSQALADIERVYKEMKPNIPFSSHFLDADYAALYKKEQQTTKVMQLFALVTIAIACIGLFALSAYAAQQRIKEIGIRKVLGASVGKIVTLLTVDFIKLVVIAFVIAIPLGWWAMREWLQNFAYRINIEWWVFIAAGLITLIVSFLTISSQAMKAALANPVNSLKDE